jgi:hypothetical protein
MVNECSKVRKKYKHDIKQGEKESVFAELGFGSDNESKEEDSDMNPNLSNLSNPNKVPSYFLEFDLRTKS